ncbi:hypothetical protein ACFVYD_28440 [Streptomyces sp. NPDC058301]|uniref:hypothetical protein n=1 Tax=Streptomyces sp. NPDC058301 TaxID=3346436 RepID=UPI0036E0BB8D
MNQFVHHDDLWWDSEFSCDTCGTYLCEHAGPGPAPDDVRQALVAAHGSVRLRLAGPVPSLVPVLKVFREVSAASLPQAREMAGALSREGLVGTMPEMEFLKAKLRAAGILADLDR